MIVSIIVMILIIILIIIGFILFEPISFNIKAGFGEENKFSFSAHTLLHFLSVKYCSSASDRLVVSILGLFKIPVPDDDDPDSGNDSNDKAESSSERNSKEIRSKASRTESNAGKSSKGSYGKRGKNRSGFFDRKKNNKSGSGSRKSNRKKKKKPVDAVLSIINKLTDVNIFSAIGNLIKNAAGIIKSFHIHFKDSRISYSAGSPDLTGYVTGFFSVMPFSYMKGLSIEPDFTGENAYFNGHIEARGHIIIIAVIIFLIRILLNDDVRKLIDAVKGKE